MARPRYATLALALLVACDGGGGGVDGGADAGADAGPAYPTHCENVNPVHCLLPWPSSRFLEGGAIALPADGAPVNTRNAPLDPSLFARFDGFSPMTPMVTSFPGRVDGSLLHGEDAIEATLAPDSTTILLDAETGERVAHYAEVDGWEDTDPERAPLYLRPAARLREGRRYVVAIRGLRTEDGSAIEASPYFRALRDAEPLPDAEDIEDHRARFEEIFGILEAAGVPRAELLEAWDFRTATGPSLYGDLLHMRDDAMTRVGAEGLGCTVTTVEEGEGTREEVHRVVRGTFTAPLYLEDASATRLRRGADGRPVADASTFEVPFTVVVPESVRARVAAGGEPARFHVYGHGLVSSRLEIETGWHVAHAAQLEIVSVATDWIGLAEDDLATVVLALQNLNDFPGIPERLHQGVVDVLVLTRSFMGVCADLPELQIELDAGGTAPAYDRTRPYYYGNSMGGVLGTTLAALSPDIERFVVGVNGASFPTFMKRSSLWRTYAEILKRGYRDPLEGDLLVAMLAPWWDTVESSTYAPHVLADPLPGSSPRRVLMQIGRWDAVLANVASDMQARTMGLPMLTPSPYVPFGLEETAGPADSAMVVYDIGADPLPPGTVNPGEPTGAHEEVRRLPTALDQIDRFLAPDGLVEHTCDGPCDPD